MIMPNRRAGTAIFVAGVVTAAGSLMAAPAAQAHPVESGTLTVTGDPGNWITGGDDFGFDVASGDTISITGGESHTGVHVVVNGANGDQWVLKLAAGAGQELTVGSYPDATYLPYGQEGNLLYLEGNHRGCDVAYEGSGSFEIADVAFGTNDYVERLDATFEYRCVGDTGSLHGRIVVGNNSPGPVPLEISAAAGAHGVVDTTGQATVHGTVACNLDARVSVSGRLAQVQAKKLTVEGFYSAIVDCVAGETAQWSGTARPVVFGVPDAKFKPGKVELTGSAWADDPFYPTGVSVHFGPSPVTLTKAPTPKPTPPAPKPPKPQQPKPEQPKPEQPKPAPHS